MKDSDRRSKLGPFPLVIMPISSWLARVGPVHCKRVSVVCDPCPPQPRHPPIRTGEEKAAKLICSLLHAKRKKKKAQFLTVAWPDMEKTGDWLRAPCSELWWNPPEGGAFLRKEVG